MKRWMLLVAGTCVALAAGQAEAKTRFGFSFGYTAPVAPVYAYPRPVYVVPAYPQYYYPHPYYAVPAYSYPVAPPPAYYGGSLYIGR